MYRHQSMRIFTTLGLVFLAAPFALADSPSVDKAVRPDPANEVLLNGRVREVIVLRSSDDGIARRKVLARERGTHVVHLAPAEYLEKLGYVPKVGDRVEIKGAKVKRGTTQVIVASRLTRGDKTVVLRDSHGSPCWSPEQAKASGK